MQSKKYSWITSDIQNYQNLTDFLVCNKVLLGFEKNAELENYFYKIQQAVQAFDTDYKVEAGQNYQLHFLKNFSTQEHLQANWLPFASLDLSTILNQQLVINFESDNEADTYQRQLFEIFISDLLSDLIIYFELLAEKTKFKKKSAQHIFNFSNLLDEKLTILAPIFQQKNSTQHFFYPEVIDDLNNFLDVILSHLNYNDNNVNKILLDDLLCLDLVETLLKHRFLFPHKNQLIQGLFDLIQDFNHPLYKIVQTLYYQEFLIEKQGEIRLQKSREKLRSNINISI